MSEKEFLQNFIKYGDIVGIDPYEDVEPEDTETTNDRIIDEFLEEHHKEYYEVEFIKKEEMDKFYKQMDNELREEQEAKEGIKGWDI